MSARDPQGRDLPLLRWGEALRRRKSDHIRQRRFAGTIGILCGLTIASGVLRPHPRLVWNASASAPLGLYAVRSAERLRRGELVVASPPPTAARLAAERGYLPAGVPLVKHIAGLPGDRICADQAILSVNGRPVALRLPADTQGRRLPLWHGCVTLGPTRYLLLNPDVARSFDGRYFGPSDYSEIVGRAVPLWVR